MEVRPCCRLMQHAALQCMQYMLCVYVEQLGTAVAAAAAASLRCSCHLDLVLFLLSTPQLSH
jgi:hypothetical protein